MIYCDSEHYGRNVLKALAASCAFMNLGCCPEAHTGVVMLVRERTAKNCVNKETPKMYSLPDFEKPTLQLSCCPPFQPPEVEH